MLNGVIRLKPNASGFIIKINVTLSFQLFPMHVLRNEVHSGSVRFEVPLEIS